MKLLKKIITAILCFSLVLTLAVPIYAQNEIVIAGTDIDKDLSEGVIQVDWGTTNIDFADVPAYSFNVDEPGAYSVEIEIAVNLQYSVPITLYVNDVSLGRNYYQTSTNASVNGFVTFKSFDAGTASLHNGTNTLKFVLEETAAGVDGTVRINKITLTKLDAAKLTSVYIGSEKLESNKLYARGTDFLKISYSDTLNKNSLSDITLSDEEGNPIGIKAELDETGKTIIIALKDSLEYGKSYLLSIRNVSDGLGAMVDETDVLFDVITDEGEDNGTDYAEITEFTISEGIASVSGVIKSSLNVGISGRSVEIYITEPGGKEEKIATCDSGTDGVFSTACSLLSGSEKGDYKVRALSEYGGYSEEKTCYYLPETLAEGIWLALNDAVTSDDVYEILNENSQALGLNLTDDTEGIEDVSCVYERLIGANVSDMNEFILLYNGAIALEKINQGNSVSVIESVFQNEKYVKGLTVSKEKYEIVDNKSALFAELWENKPFENVNELAELFDTSFNEILKEQLGFSDVFLSSQSSVEIKKGTSVSLDVVAKKQINNIKEISLLFEFDSRISGAINDFFAESSFGNVKVESNNGTYIVMITDINEKEMKNLAQISFLSEKTGSAGFTASGSVTVGNSTGFDVILEIEPLDYAVTVLPAETTSENIKILGKDYKSITPTYSIYDDGLNFLSSCIPVYDVTVPDSGVYDVYVELGVWQQYSQPATVYVNGESLGSVVYYTGEGVANGWQNFKVFNAGSAYFNKGLNTLKIQFDEHIGDDVSLFLQNITIKKAADTELISFKIGEKECSDKNLYPRGADYFVAGYTGKMDEDSLSDITVTDAEGKELLISAGLDESKKNIVISLKETLQYDSTYMVKLKGIKDLYGMEMAEESFEFTTVADSKKDSGTETAEINSFTIANGKAKITGIIKSSKGEGIKGRTLAVYISAPVGLGQMVSDIVSGDEGTFEVVCNLDDIATGTYISKVRTAYGHYSQESKFYYIPESISENIWLSLKEAEDYKEVEDVIKQNASILDIRPSSDLSGIYDTSLVYTHLIGIEVSDVYEFKKCYNAAIALERINQADSADTILSVLGNLNYIAALEISEDKLAVVDDKNVLSTEILKADRVESVENFLGIFDAAFNETLKKQADISDVNLITDSDSVYVGQKAELDISAEKSFSKVKEIELEITFDENVADSIIEFKLKSDFGVVTATKNNNKYDVKISDVKTDTSIEKILNLSFGLNETENISFTVKGTATCDSGTKYDVVSNINEQQYSVIISALQTSNPVSGGSGGSGGGKGSSVAPSVNVPSYGTDDTTNVTKEYEFTDLAGAEWAESSIKKLLARQVLSMPEDCAFNPHRNVTRAEFAKMIVLAFDLWIDSTVEFIPEDVSEESWYYGYIYAAYSQGIMGGDGNGYFNPEANITREDMCVMINRAIKMKDGLQSEPFSDDNLISAYAKDAVYYAKGAGIINGVGDNMFNPKGYATRAMAAKVVCGALEVNK